MKSSSLIFLGGLLIIILTDFFLWYQLRQYFHKRWQLLLFILQSLLFIISLILFQVWVPQLKGPGGYFWIGKLIGIIFLFYTPKFIFVVFNGLGLLFRRMAPAFCRIMHILAACVTGLLFLILLYSITLGRYNFRIEKTEIPITGLPHAFNGFRIVQLSDIHLGSYGESYAGITKMVQIINDLHPDIIVFTGDMVNNFAGEMLPWISTLKNLKAPFGKYAVTGNHDYGDYTQWPNPEQKKANLEHFFQNMEKMGFHMLNNTRIPIVHQGDTLWLAGVENWGNPPFPRYGKLYKALDSLKQGDPVVLLSHDPSHWKEEVLKYRVPLTLSGHTHAMQLGLKIGKYKWSPAQYLYPEYDGLYCIDNQYLHVSRGQGYLGFPGRIGLRPVITELTLVASTR